MKTLYLVRHAKSSWDDTGVSDFERTLNERGLRDAPMLAKILKEKKVKPDLIISSPANRAFSTSKLFAGILKYSPNKIATDQRIYDGGLRELSEVVEEIDDSKKTVLFFGHNPGITNFSNLLGDQQLPELPTCAVVGLDLNTNSWKEVERHCGKVILFEYPKKHYK